MLNFLQNAAARPGFPQQCKGYTKSFVNHPRCTARQVEDNEWMNGEELLLRFARSEIASRVQLVEGGNGFGFSETEEAKGATLTKDRRSEVWVMSPDRAMRIASADDEEGRWGEVFRRHLK